jgi:hypothetical protein
MVFALPPNMVIYLMRLAFFIAWIATIVWVAWRMEKLQFLVL